MNHVIVSSGESIWRCTQARAGWFCGKCGQFIGAHPQIGQECSQCKAKVEEAMDIRARHGMAKQ